MPLFSPKRQVSDTENKLRLLLCIDALGAVPEAQLWPFVASLELMEYIPMQLLLHELLTGGDVEMGTHALSQQLFLTSQGQKSLGLFEGRIMPSDVERIRQAAPTYRANLQKRREIHALYEKAQPGDYRVRMTLQEGDIPTLCLELSTQSRELAAQAKHSFEAQAPAILLHLYSLATQAVHQEGREAPADRPWVAQHSAHEYTVTSVYAQGSDRLVTSLLLPSLEQAHAYMRLFSGEEQARASAEVVLTLLAKGKSKPEP